MLAILAVSKYQPWIGEKDHDESTEDEDQKYTEHNSSTCSEVNLCLKVKC